MNLLKALRELGDTVERKSMVLQKGELPHCNTVCTDRKMIHVRRQNTEDLVDTVINVHEANVRLS